MASRSAVESRSATVAGVAAALSDSGGVSDRDAFVIRELLRKLIGEAAQRVAGELPCRLAGVALSTSALSLLRDPEPELARPRLLAGLIAHESAVAEAVRHRAWQHQVAGRVDSSADARVTTGGDLLITLLADGEPEVAGAAGAHVRESAAAADELGEPLLPLDRLSPAVVRGIHWWVGAALRSALLERSAVEPARLDQAIEDSVRFLSPTVEEPDQALFRPSTATARLADELAIRDRVTGELLIGALRQGHVTLYEHLIARLLNLAPTRMARISLDRSGHGLIIACRALDLDPATFATLYLLHHQGGDKAVRDPAELSRVLGVYGSIEPADARRVVPQWRRNPRYQEALETIGAG